MPLRKSNQVMRGIRGAVYDLPSPSNLSIW